jgi:hypothetical protein
MKARDLVIQPCALSDVRQFIETNHYSHNVNGVKIAFCFKVLFNDALVGGIIFGGCQRPRGKDFQTQSTR